jgi:hypothetical protein
MKLLSIITILFFSQLSFSQSVYILRVTDKMDDTETYIVSRTLLVSNDDKHGFKIACSFKKKNGKVDYNGLSVISAGVGTCMEKDLLDILFEDGSKLHLVGFNNFNCKGYSFFDLGGRELPNLKKPIKAIRLTNGRDSGEKYTGDVTKKDDKEYFIHVQKAIDAQLIENYKE